MDANECSKLKHVYISVALEFALCGRVFLSSKEYKQWSKLRHALQATIVSAVAAQCGEEESKADDDDGPQKDDDGPQKKRDASKFLLAALSQQCASGDGLDKLLGDADANGNFAILQNIEDFMAANPVGKPPRFHPSLTATMSEVFDDIQGFKTTASNVTTSDVVQIFSKRVFAERFPLSWVTLLEKAKSTVDRQGDVNAKLTAVFKGKDDMSQFQSLRVKYMTTCVRDLFGEEGPCTSDAATSTIARNLSKQVVVKELCKLDCNIHDIDDWRSIWTEVLNVLRNPIPDDGKERVEQLFGIIRRKHRHLRRNDSEVSQQPCVDLVAAGGEDRPAVKGVVPLGRIFDSADLDSALPRPSVDVCVWLRAYSDVAKNNNLPIMALNTLYLRRLCLLIESTLYDKCFFSTSASAFEKIKINVLDKKPQMFLHADDYEMDFQLPFIGSIGLSSSGNAALVSVLNISVGDDDSKKYPVGIYLRPDKVNSVTSEMLVPAWLVPALKEKDADDAMLSISHDVVEVLVGTIHFASSPNPFGIDLMALVSFRPQPPSFRPSASSRGPRGPCTWFTILVGGILDKW